MHLCLYRLSLSSLSIVFSFFDSVHAFVENLDSVEKFEKTVESTELVLVNFHAEWCRFSQMLNPIFESAANTFVNDVNVKFASVDCDRQSELAQRFHINKYPVIKLFRFGKPAKREYKGSRSTEAIRDYILDQQKEVMKVWANDDEMAHNIDPSKRSVLAHIRGKESMEYHAYRHIAAALNEYCDFHVVISPAQDFATSANTLMFQSLKADLPRNIFPGDPFKNFNDTETWVTDQCIPLVREITFENAEDLTEEGLPFLILFRQKDDEKSLDEFTKAIKTELHDQRESINALHADGEKFAHPLHHLGKTPKDLPLIAIDSFKHMYMFPDYKYLNKKNRLRRFVEDMHSGKLHREFHYGPDPGSQPYDDDETETTAETRPPSESLDSSEILPVPVKELNEKEKLKLEQKKTPPPVPSVFQKLKPSRTRYTLKDEL